MPLAHHTDVAEKFRQQRLNADRYVVPFIEAAAGPVAGRRVLEIGCGEGGVLVPFLERGCTVLGVDLSPSKIARAQELVEAEHGGRARFVSADVYDLVREERLRHAFDLVVLKDTVEHVPDQGRLLAALQGFLAPGGVAFFAFPPWRMPYGGHQQIADSLPGKLPYYHLLPRPLYRRVLKALGETDRKVEELMEIQATRLSIGHFERLLQETGYRTLRRELYLIRPIYAFKFGLKPVRQLPGLRHLPGVRDFLTTAAFYVVAPA